MISDVTTVCGQARNFLIEPEIARCLPTLIRDMRERGRGPVSCAFALVRLGHFGSLEDALRAVCRYFGV